MHNVVMVCIVQDVDLANRAYNSDQGSTVCLCPPFLHEDRGE